jgi:hypothetical protein
MHEAEVVRCLTALPPSIQARLLAVVHPMNELEGEQRMSLWAALARLEAIAREMNRTLEAKNEPRVEGLEPVVNAVADLSLTTHFEGTEEDV